MHPPPGPPSGTVSDRRPARRTELGRGLTALGLAVCLWYFVGSQDEAEILATTPLELRNVPPGLEVVRQSVQEVDVRLRGASALLRDAPLGALRAFVDLSGEDHGERAWFLGVESVEAPPGVQVMRVMPSQVALQLERTMDARVRVSPRVLGEPATGFEIHRITIEPANLLLEGPESLLADLEQVTTEPISAQGLRETYARRLQVELDPALRPSVREVEVRLLIDEEREPRDLRLTVRAAGSGSRAGAAGDAGAGLPCRVETPRVAASLRVPKHLGARVTPETLFAEVSCAELPEGVHRVTPELRFTESGAETIAVVAFDPETVEVRVGAPEAAAPETPPPAAAARRGFARRPGAGR